MIEPVDLDWADDAAEGRAEDAQGRLSGRSATPSSANPRRRASSTQLTRTGWNLKVVNYESTDPATPRRDDDSGAAVHPSRDATGVTGGRSKPPCYRATADDVTKPPPSGVKSIGSWTTERTAPPNCWTTPSGSTI